MYAWEQEKFDNCFNGMHVSHDLMHIIIGSSGDQGDSF